MIASILKHWHKTNLWIFRETAVTRWWMGGRSIPMSCFPPQILLREQTPAMEPGPVNIRICPPFMRTGILTGSLRGVCSFGETELIIHTANYSHYYGGIWYVPIIGDVDSINHLSAARMLLYGGFCAAALTLALFCMVYWKRRETDASAVTFYFGMISLSFALRICYPFFDCLVFLP